MILDIGRLMTDQVHFSAEVGVAYRGLGIFTRDVGLGREGECVAVLVVLALLS